MTLFFPDLNVWLALSVTGHLHGGDAWRWMGFLPSDTRLIFSRYTQIGLLRLLTSSSVMGSHALVLGEAWKVYDRWLQDPRVEFYPEPRGVDSAFREATEPFRTAPASKCVGDCWLLANAMRIQATLVTFDRALFDQARKLGHSAIIPA